MTEVERIVRIFHESWEMRDPERGVAVIAPDCQFEDVARSEQLIGPRGYVDDYHRWRTEFPDGSVMRVQDGMVVEGRDYYDAASIARQLGLVS